MCDLLINHQWLPLLQLMGGHTFLKLYFQEIETQIYFYWSVHLAYRYIRRYEIGEWGWI